MPLQRSFAPWIFSGFLSFFVFVAYVQARAQETAKLPIVSGTVCDAESHPLSGAEVFLDAAGTAKPARSIRTDAQGHFQFDALTSATYTLRAVRDGYRQAQEGPFDLQAGETKSITLHLAKLPLGATGADDSSGIAFADQPQFTVAGVTDTTALGVHASSRALPNSSAMAKDTVALAHESGSVPSSNAASAARESEIRSALAKSESADLRFQLAEMEEAAGYPVEAANDYQRAAELAPTETHLFAWGAELLLHRAFEPAFEVFSKGHAHYPDSVRMLLGLGATKYAQGAREDAAQFFLQASDLDPANPQPYMFLEPLLATETAAPPGWTERMRRFAELHPDNATAHYLYGLALTKQSDKAGAAEAESQFNKAISLDPRLGDAYLQLGILHAQRKDFSAAIAALQKAVEYMPFPEAHYRLAEVYRRMGDTEKARQETALYKEVSEQKSQDAERERHQIQQFIYTLRGPAVSTPSPEPKP